MSKKSISVSDKLRKLSLDTQRGYKVSIKRYEQYHGTTMEEMICEALEEQSNRIPYHELTIIDRLEDFQNYLIDEGLCIGTIRTYVGKVKATYTKFRVNIPPIEELDPKNIRRREYIEHSDCLTKEELKKALPYMRPVARARAMVMIQGGLSNEE